METPKPPPRRCRTCNKRIYATEADARALAVRLRLDAGLYRSVYRCPGNDAEGGWHLRDIIKRYNKIKEHNGPETRELAEEIKRLDSVPPDRRQKPLERQLKKLGDPARKPIGRAGTRARNKKRSADHAAERGTAKTAHENELRRRRERARLREELRREETDE